MHQQPETELLSLWIDDFPLYARQELKIATAFTEGKKDFLNVPAIRPFVLNRPQEYVWKHHVKPKFDNHLPIRIYLLKERQGGWSTFFCGLTDWRIKLNRNTGAYVLAHDQTTAENLFLKHELFYKYASYKPMYNRFNRRMIRFSNPDPKSPIPGLESCIANDSVDDDVGASFALSIAHFTEVSRFEGAGCDVSKTMQSLLPTIPYAPGTMIIYESTAEEGGDFFKNAFMNQTDKTYDYIFISWISEETYRRPWTAGRYFDLQRNPDSAYGNELEAAEEITKELKFWYKEEIPDDHTLRHKLYERLAFRRDMIMSDTCMGNVSTFKRIYPTTVKDAFLGQTKGFFPAFVLSEREKTIEKAEETKELLGVPFLITRKGFNPHVKSLIKSGDPDWFVKVLMNEIGDRGALTIFEGPIAGKKYGLGADPSLGLEDGDKCGAVMLKNGDPHKEVATWNHSIRPHEFAYLLYAMAAWYNWAEIGCESNNMGHTTFSNLLHELSYPNIYLAKKIDRKPFEEMSEDFGWYTEKRSKWKMLTDAREAMWLKEVELYSLDTIRECLKFQKMPNGELGIPDGTAKGKSANLVMALCIAVQMMKADYKPTEERPPETNPQFTGWTVQEALRNVERKSRIVPFRQQSFGRRYR